MAYYIFLKSLRSLEEFRKNPHVKIPPKSPSTNFPSIGKFKIQFLIQKSFFFTFGPATQPRPISFFPYGRFPLPTGPQPQPARPQPPPALACRPARAAEPPRPRPTGFIAARPTRVLGVFCEIHFLLDFTPSVRSVSSLRPLTPGPHLSGSSSPPRRPTPAAPPSPAPRLGIPLGHYRPATITPPLNSPSNPSLIAP
jgi:hypothetical protein